MRAASYLTCITRVAAGLLLVSHIYPPCAGQGALTDKEAHLLELLVTTTETTLDQTSWRSVVEITSTRGTSSGSALNTEMKMENSVRARKSSFGGFSAYTREEALRNDGDASTTSVLEVSRQGVDDDGDPWVRFSTGGALASVALTALPPGFPTDWFRQSSLPQAALLKSLCAARFNDPGFVLNTTAFGASVDRIEEVRDLGRAEVEGVGTLVISVAARPRTADSESLEAAEDDRALADWARDNLLASPPTLLSVDIPPSKSEVLIESMYWIDIERRVMIKMSTSFARTSAIASISARGNLTMSFSNYNEATSIPGPNVAEDFLVAEDAGPQRASPSRIFGVCFLLLAVVLL